MTTSAMDSVGRVDWLMPRTPEYFNGQRIATLRNPVTGMSLRVLQSAAHTSGALLELEAEYPPASVRPPEHLHPRQEEQFVVLAGTMRAVVNGVHHELAAGDSLTIRAGDTHAMWNAGSTQARVNWKIRPALRTLEFFECMYGLAAAGKVDAHGTPRLHDLATLLPRYSEEFVVTSPPRVVQWVVFGVVRVVARMFGRG
jgi:mannose-6-phosphate isomerase-like protein (cupin superfamily)